jgi:hypothetical protein
VRRSGFKDARHKLQHAILPQQHINTINNINNTSCHNNTSSWHALAQARAFSAQALARLRAG